MSCFNPGGNPPQPPRVWFRVQGRCSTDPSTSNSPVVYFPLTKEFLSVQDAANEFRMIEKGNVLQYKKNSGDITKKQRYSKIATGKWTDRHSTFATQGYNFTDPNTKRLRRVNYRTIYADDGTEANLPVTCPEPTVIPIPAKLPPRVGTRPGPPSPPPQPVNPEVGPNTELDPNYPSQCPQYVDPTDYVPPGPILETSDQLPSLRDNKWPAMVLPYVKPSLPEEERIVIADGGNLVCGPDNICPTPESSERKFYKSDNCNLTTSSDAPGPIQTLCYNSRKLATFYPRQRYVMGSSGGKFPTGYKFKNPPT